MWPELILERIPTGVLCLGPEGRITFANPRAAQMLGCDSPDDLVGQPIRTYIQFFSHGSPGAAGEEVCLRDDGTSFPLAYESAPLPEGGTVLTLSDVSEQRAADQRQAELISVVSHELRTPLTSIRSVLGLLASGLLGQLTGRGQGMLDVAVNNTDRLIRLLSDLLDLERLQSGNTSFGSEPCNAHDLMLCAADSVRGMAEEAQVTIHVSPTDASLIADRDRLLQVLINLLSNAIKFSPAAGASVWLDVEAASGEILFRVRDEGRGIPSDKLETIFERFAQVESDDSRRKGGSGLGLAISRAIVQQHGGQIWAESTPGAGTTLCVALPSEAASAFELRRAA